MPLSMSSSELPPYSRTISQTASGCVSMNSPATISRLPAAVVVGVADETPRQFDVHGSVTTLSHLTTH